MTANLPSAPADSLRASDPLGTTDHARALDSDDVSQPSKDAPVSDLPAVPGYRVLREIARGGMGRVLAAHDLALGRDVALKVLLPGADADRFVRESKITARLPHPGVPPVHALGTLADGSPFLAMKLIDGQTLTDVMKTADRPRLLQAFTQVCQTVGFAHSRGVIHRDLKPHNVMVGAFGEVQVMDWGLAKDLTGREVADEPRAPAALTVPAVGTDGNQPPDQSPPGESPADRTQAGQVMGTPAYMAPEQARGEAADARADVFALGGILCAILTGQPPFGGKSMLETLHHAEAADLGETLARLDGSGADEELIALCRGCLSPSPADRPADGQALADRLTAYSHGVQERLHQAELAEAEAHARAAEEAKRRRLTLALAATVLLAVTLGGGGWLYVKADRDARAARVTRDVNDALNRAAALREQAKAASVGGPALLAQAREQAQRASVLAGSAPIDDQLSARVRDLQEELGAAEKDQQLLAALDAAWLAQAEIAAGEGRFASEQAVPKFREAFAAYGMPAGEGDPEAVAARIRERPARVRDTIVAALDEWVFLADNPKMGITEPHQDWLLAVALAVGPEDGLTRQLQAARRQRGTARREALEKLAAEADVGKLPASALTGLARALRASQAEAAAVRLLRLAQQQHPADFWVNQGLGKVLLTVKPPDYAEAVRYLTAAVALRPESSGAHANLGVALRGKGEVDEAIACYRKAIALDPKSALAHVNLGAALYLKGQVDEAVTSYHRAIELNPKYAVAHFNLGLALEHKGQVNEAIASYRQAIALDPKYARAHTNLGLALRGKGEVDEAIACFKKAIELDPKNASPRTSLARAERLAAARDKFLAFQKGNYTPASNEERLVLAEWCHVTKLHHAAAGLSAAAFADDPRLADDLRTQRRYNAACYAALAAGWGADAAKLDEKERARLRQQALGWLRADLALRTKQLETGKPADRAAVQQALLRWQQDPDLAKLRDAAALAKLPAGERMAFTQLWADVAALLDEAKGKPK